MSGATAGTVVAKTSPEPPWIVVSHSLDTIPVTQWPGRLYHVAVVEPETAAERAVIDRANTELMPTVGYTRALGVDVIDELDPSIVFGAHGAAVVDVINAAKSLTAEQAARLASARHPRALLQRMEALARTAVYFARSRHWSSPDPGCCWQRPPSFPDRLRIHGRVRRGLRQRATTWPPRCCSCQRRRRQHTC